MTPKPEAPLHRAGEGDEMSEEPRAEISLEFAEEKIIRLEKELLQSQTYAKELEGEIKAGQALREPLVERIKELEKSAESEFQRAEGKEEMKRWFQDKIQDLEVHKTLAVEAITMLVENEVPHGHVNYGAQSQRPCAVCESRVKGRIALSRLTQSEGK